MIYEDMIVTLTAGELLHAGLEASRRYATSRRGRDRAGQPGSLDQDFAGICGEMAVAKLTGRYWTGSARGHTDVSGLEVRTARGDHLNEDLHLIIQPYDEQRHPDTPFVLVVGNDGRYRIVGWTTPRDARLFNGTPRDPGNTGRPALFVAQSSLLPIDEFRVGEVPATEAA